MESVPRDAGAARLKTEELLDLLPGREAERSGEPEQREKHGEKPESRAP